MKLAKYIGMMATSLLVGLCGLVRVSLALLLLSGILAAYAGAVLGKENES